MIARAMAASEPSSPARGTTLRTQPLTRAQASLKIPEASSMAMPRNQACRAAASAARPRPSAAWKDGPMIRITEPNVLGVSSPRGIAVTSVRPVLRARRNAIAVKIRSPTSTPTAVPGIIRESTKSRGIPNPTSKLVIRIMPLMLSIMSPKKALRSPPSKPPVVMAGMRMLSGDGGDAHAPRPSLVGSLSLQEPGSLCLDQQGGSRAPGFPPARKPPRSEAMDSPRPKCIEPSPPR